MPKIGKTDDEKVKTTLVKAIEEAAGKKDWPNTAALSREYARLRGVETKADQGDWGDELVTPNLDHMPRMPA